MEGISAQDIAATKPDCRGAAALFAQAQNVAIGKTKLTPLSTFALAVMAGMLIATGATFMLLVKGDTNLGFAASQLLGGLCFSLGLLCVIIAGAELFTGNCLMVCAAADKKISWGAVLKNWGIVYVGNLVGSLLMVAILLGANYAGMAGGAVGDAMINVANSKISLSPSAIFFRGIMCNWLVCLAVWMGFAGRTVIDKVFTSIFPVMAFVACGFEHCVANMFFLPMGIAALNTVGYTGEIDPAKLDAIMQTVTAGGACYNIALATLGNIVGGAILVGMIYWVAYHKKA
ncbi:Formate channel 1 [Slackia heliotrinireducens]|uniref:Formate/nitrite transporter family protein n=1 Tax=Slackia heliotrinireducens (strain ATCC 29202 / DSM 20476 / NCTC 11029 / RHS 1) TaxID=471855 RepID=C7N2L4_SLAHD|nr:formate/nitrite transporter family protein [Slackia heliotrinireducens]ACV23522.1 formate/nitrite transporter family protein [Slackia heliotrinireducens DSM 20476]VEH02910.1 Formate channel 1 [Slackia heliotrinireducens]